MFELTVKFEIKHKEISVCIAFRLIVLFFNTAERERERERARERERERERCTLSGNRKLQNFVASPPFSPYMLTKGKAYCSPPIPQVGPVNKGQTDRDPTGQSPAHSDHPRHAV